MRPDLKVIYLTGYSHRALARDGRLDPRLNVLQKPVTQNELAARIQDALEVTDGRSRRQAEE
jgi:FixJ family two-component response regulator